jgi:phosphatidylglycerophosphate synthase
MQLRAIKSLGKSSRRKLMISGSGVMILVRWKTKVITLVQMVMISLTFPNSPLRPRLSKLSKIQKAKMPIVVSVTFLTMKMPSRTLLQPRMMVGQVVSKKSQKKNNRTTKMTLVTLEKLP